MRLFPLVVMGVLLGFPASAQDLKRDTFEKWHTYILPKEGEERWCAYEWRTSLWDAVIEAQKKDRPILLWSMHGHPMGET